MHFTKMNLALLKKLEETSYTQEFVIQIHIPSKEQLLPSLGVFMFERYNTGENVLHLFFYRVAVYDTLVHGMMFRIS